MGSSPPSSSRRPTEEGGLRPLPNRIWARARVRRAHRTAARSRHILEAVTAFDSPTELIHNRGLIADPAAFAREHGAASWLFLCGEEFASMEGGMSYADVQAAVPRSANVV